MANKCYLNLMLITILFTCTLFCINACACIALNRIYILDDFVFVSTSGNLYFCVPLKIRSTIIKNNNRLGTFT